MLIAVVKDMTLLHSQFQFLLCSSSWNVLSSLLSCFTFTLPSNANFEFSR